MLDDTQWQQVIEFNPFPTDEGKLLHFFFLESPSPQPNLTQLESIKAETEQYLLTDKVFYLYAPDGIGRSKLAAAVEKQLGIVVTARNWNTINKLSTILASR